MVRGAPELRRFREPSPGFTELTTSFEGQRHSSSSTIRSNSDDTAPFSSSPTTTTTNDDGTTTATHLHNQQQQPLETILSPSQQKKKALIDSPYKNINKSLLLSSSSTNQKNNNDEGSIICAAIPPPMLEDAGGGKEKEKKEDEDPKKDSNNDDSSKKDDPKKDRKDTDRTVSDVDIDAFEVKEESKKQQQEQLTKAAALFFQKPATTTSGRSSGGGSGSGGRKSGGGGATGMGMEALKRLGLGQRQVSERWNKLLRTSSQVALVKRKITQKKIKLHNLCAERLEDDESFKPLVYEKKGVDKLVVHDAMKHNFVFDTLDPLVLERLANAMEHVEFKAGETIIKQGDKGDYFYAIKEGEVDFFVDNVKVGNAPAGRSFGELALLYTCHRAATVKASITHPMKVTTLFRMDQKSFRHILKDQMKKSRHSKLKLLHKIKPFREIDKSDLKVLAAAMEPRLFEKGDVIWTKGDPSPPFCAVLEGELDFTNIHIGNRECKDKKLGPGDYFGEQSLGNREPAEGTVTALSRVLVFCIDRETFDRDFGGLKRLVDKSMDKRRLSVMASIKKANLDDDALNTLADHVVDITFEAGCTIFEKAKDVSPAIYLVREGTIELVRTDGGDSEKVTAGGSFGQEMEKYKTTKLKSGKTRHSVVAEYTATAIERTVCGVLSLPDCPIVFDSELIEKVTERYTPASCDLSLDDLTRHRVLGEGQFGEVWLVSSKKEEVPKGMALKIQSKTNKSRPAAVKAIWEEIKSMQKLNHNLLVSLISTFQDKNKIYMLLTLAHGGELFDIIHQEDDQGNFVSGIGEKGKFYAAVVADAIAFMHRQKYVYRDLKPENILIDEVGYPILTDFGFAKCIEDKTYTFCGTPNYLPPEVIANSGHDWSADNWSLGVLIYELLEGENPFYYHGMDQMALFEAICTEKYYPMAKEVSTEALHLIDKLLIKNPNMRLGTFREKDILAHPWFSSMDFVKLRNKELEAPWIPDPLKLD